MLNKILVLLLLNLTDGKLLNDIDYHGKKMHNSKCLLKWVIFKTKFLKDSKTIIFYILNDLFHMRKQAYKSYRIRFFFSFKNAESLVWGVGLWIWDWKYSLHSIKNKTSMECPHNDRKTSVCMFTVMNHKNVFFGRCLI